MAEKNGKYGESVGQMGNLAAVTSPPWEKSVQAQDPKYQAAGDGHGARHSDYGDAEGQIGQETQETYWQAVEAVYRQVYELFSPGSHMACVVKSFVRNKQIVPLPEMTLALLESIGFTPVLWVDCALVEHIEPLPTMFEEVPATHGKERKSFFRRLAEKKGSPRIDSEILLVVKKL